MTFTVYRTTKFLKIFAIFDQILHIFLEKLSVSGGLRPPDPLGLPLHSHTASAATVCNAVLPDFLLLLSGFIVVNYVTSSVSSL